MLSTDVQNIRKHTSDNHHEDRHTPQDPQELHSPSNHVASADPGGDRSCHASEEMKLRLDNSRERQAKQPLQGGEPWAHSAEMSSSTNVGNLAQPIVPAGTSEPATCTVWPTTIQGSSGSSWLNPRLLALSALMAQAQVRKWLAAASRSDDKPGRMGGGDFGVICVTIMALLVAAVV